MLKDEYSPEFLAILREAELAAELLASGVTTLGKANAPQSGWYRHVYFNLSIGLERACKIALVTNHCLAHAGTFPTDAELRKYGHNVKELLAHANEISQQRRASSVVRNCP